MTRLPDVNWLRQLAASSGCVNWLRQLLAEFRNSLGPQVPELFLSLLLLLQLLLLLLLLSCSYCSAMRYY